VQLKSKETSKKMPRPITTYCLSIIIPDSAYDLVYARLYEMGMLGCEETKPAMGTHLKIYFVDETTALLASVALKEQFTISFCSVEKVVNQDWNAKWRESMEPALIAPGWYVSPVWLPPPADCQRWIKIEPKMAFGTGHHETTRLASQAIITEKRRIGNKSILDIGSGSGVLCFVADLCGAGTCIGVELDECCRENMAENLRENVPRGRINFLMGSTSALNDHPGFSLIVMNMILTESAPLLDKVASLLKPDGRFIWSGILKDEDKETIALALKAGFVLTSEKTENEWWCGVFALRIAE
jgi:ribosomal protein L11 methyltransferase